MANATASPEYTILLTREGGSCVASIAELALAVRSATPAEALAALLQAEGESRRALVDAGTPPPPPAGRLDPAPAASRAAARAWPFLRGVLAGYFVVALLTALLAAIALPYARARAEQYLGGGGAAADLGRLLSRLGVAVCAERR